MPPRGRPKKNSAPVANTNNANNQNELHSLTPNGLDGQSASSQMIPEYNQHQQHQPIYQQQQQQPSYPITRSAAKQQQLLQQQQQQQQLILQQQQQIESSFYNRPLPFANGVPPQHNADIFGILSGGGVTTSGVNNNGSNGLPPLTPNSSNRTTPPPPSQVGSSNFIMDQIQSLASLNGSQASSAPSNGIVGGTDKKIQMGLLQLREMSGSSSRASSISTSPPSSQELNGGSGPANEENQDDEEDQNDNQPQKRRKRNPKTAKPPAAAKPAKPRASTKKKKPPTPPQKDDDEEDDSDDDDDEPSTKKKKPTNRFDNSLVQLTRKFIDLVEQAPDCILDLKVAADKIEITKRRIYDVTCVLEGVGLIEKCSKNQVQWRGVDSPVATTQRNHASNNNNNNNSNGNGNSSQQQTSTTSTTSSTSTASTVMTQSAHNEVIKMDMKKMLEKEAKIDENYKNTQKNIQSLLQEATSCGFFFVTYNDLREIETLRNDTLIAIKAPSGTKLEVPDPDEGMEPPNRRYQIYLNNENGMPIDVFLLSQQSQADSSNGSMSEDDQNNTNSSVSMNQVNQAMVNAMDNNNNNNYNFGNTNTNIAPPSPIRTNNSQQQILQPPPPPQPQQQQILQQPNVQFSNNTTYWEPHSTIASYSPFADIQQQQAQLQQPNQQQVQYNNSSSNSTTPPNNNNNNHINTNNNHTTQSPINTNTPNFQSPTKYIQPFTPSKAIFNNSPIKSTNPLQPYSFTDNIFDQSTVTDSTYYFDTSVIESEGFSELYTDDSFLAQSFDETIQNNE